MQKFSTFLVLGLIGLLAITGATAAQTLLPNGDGGAARPCVEGSDQNAPDGVGLPCSEASQKISSPIIFNEDVIIGGDFRIGLGTSNPDRAYHMSGRNALFRADRDVDTTAFLITRTEQGNLNNIWKSYVFGVNASGVDNGEFLINDLGTQTFGVGKGRVFTIDNQQRVKVKTLCFGGQFGNDCRSDWNISGGGGGGGSISSVNGTNGITGGGSSGNITLQPDYGQIQRRINNACPGGQFMTSVDFNGNPICSTPAGGGGGGTGGTGNFSMVNIGPSPQNFSLSIDNTQVGGLQQLGIGSSGRDVWVVRDDGRLEIDDDVYMAKKTTGSTDKGAGIPSPAAVFGWSDQGGGNNSSNESYLALSPSGAVLGTSGGLDMKAQGSQMRYFLDTNGNGPPAIYTHIWFNGGFTNNNIQLALLSPGVGQAGELRSRYAFNGPTNGFDLAEGFWKSQAAIEPGDVIRVDPRAPNAVLLADREADTSVVGVVSTTPGLIMGGHAFSVEDLAEAWGQEVTVLFESERLELETAALGNSPSLQRRRIELDSLGGGSVSNLAMGTPAEEVEKLRADYESARSALEQDLEQATLDMFFKRHIAKIALAGRVPVKVDASHGVIRAGDLLVSSSTAGHAKRAGDDPAPGTVLGKALESHDGGTGRIMMLVMMR